MLQKAQEVDARLQQLPEPPAGNLPRQIHEKIFVFEAEAQKQFDGGDPMYPFRRDWNALVQRFRKVMADSRPLLNQPSLVAVTRPTIESTCGTPTPARKIGMSMPITIDSDDEEVQQKSTPLPDRTSTSKKRIKMSSPQDTPSKRSRMSDIPLFTPEKAFPKACKTVASHRSSTRTLTKWHTAYCKRFDLADVRQTLQEAHVGLPGQTDPKATDRMICLSIKVWEEPLEHFLESTIEMCQSMVSDQITKVFSQWRQTLLYSRALDIRTSFFEQAKESLRTTLANILKWEMYKPTTYNEDAMRMACENALALLKTGRRDHRAKKLLCEQDASKDKTPSRQTLDERMTKVTDAQLGPDPFSQEVEAMSVS